MYQNILQFYIFYNQLKKKKVKVAEVGHVSEYFTVLRILQSILILTHTENGCMMATLNNQQSSTNRVKNKKKKK